MATWQARWREGPKPVLRYRKGWGSLEIEDTRPGSVRRTTFTGREAALLEACADARRPRELFERFDDDRAWIEGTLAELAERGLVLALDDRYLTLALPENVHH